MSATDERGASSSLKGFLKALVPMFIRELRAKVIRAKARTSWAVRKSNREFNRNSDRQFANKSPKEVFTTIYESGLWGKGEDGAFYSGSGSHDETTVNSYVASVRSYLQALPGKPDAVDLGCGDFNVGSKIRGLCNRYVACDVVSPVIENNKIRYAGTDVDFRCIDICEDALPAGDVVFIRQVLQHLSNQQVLSVVRKLTQYKVVIITEGLPAKREFVANEDKPIGDGIRMQREISSGIVLTLPPFNLPYKSEEILCDVPNGAAVIRTTAYVLA